jgi:hypothetical protein
VAFAYHILAHKQPAQVARLVRALQHPDDCFVLHFDRRAPADLHALGAELARAHRNVQLQVPRAVVWGGPAISDLQADAMRLALGFNSAWRHFINLTGQDFPLTSRAERLARLAPGQSYLSWFDPIATGQWNNARERLEQHHWHAAWLARLLATPGLGRRLRALLGWQNRLPYCPGWRRRRPAFFKYYGGSNYMVLARAACSYLTTAPDAARIRTWLRPAAHPDEIVFQSSLLSSPLAGSLVNRDWREIDFPAHAPHPRTFTAADWPRLRGSAQLFARKFDIDVDAVILSQLEAHIGVAA